MEKIKQWFIACRGYSLPMSILCFLTAFTYCYLNKGNIFYGFLAFVAIIFVHLGVNLYDDFIDTILKTPKQKCKTEYLDKNIFSLKHILWGFIIYFFFASLIGIFFIYKIGFEILYLVVPTIIISLLYPKLSHYVPSEFFISLIFGPLMFEGISVVMLNRFDFDLFLISIPISILVGVVAMVHSFMDLDFDKVSGKKTYPSLFKTKNSAIIGIISLIIFVYFYTFWLVFDGIISFIALFSLISIYFLIKLQKSMQKYIEEKEDSAFLPNFMLCQRIFILYTVIIIISLMVS
ncbi:MAG: prenyltransferase [Cyanobacteria bacterium SIG30]|nr:prenyltransferase [Cyanobacteria bacterium SIG30]